MLSAPGRDSRATALEPAGALSGLKAPQLGQDQQPSCSLSPEHAPLLERFMEALLNSPLKAHLRAVYVFGSSARGENTRSSDLDLIVIVDELNQTAISTLHQVLSRFNAAGKDHLVQPFFWSTAQLAALPPHYFYFGARLLYGEPVLREPSPEQLKLAFKEITRNLMNTVTHYQIIDHDNAHVAGRLYAKLKQLYFSLAVQFRLEAGRFPENRKELLKALKQRDPEGFELVSILEQWTANGGAERFAKDPRPLLLKLLKYTEKLTQCTLR